MSTPMRCWVLLAAIGASAALAPGAGAASHRCGAGDPPIYVSSNTSCGLGGAIVSAWYSTCHQAKSCVRQVRSPVTGRRYTVRCSLPVRRGEVKCRGPKGIHASFSGDTG